jgi:hypothetical protein
MNFMRCGYLASGLALLLTVGPMATPAAAQSAKDARIRAALAGLHEFVEPLVEVRPELLRLQQDLVETLRAELDGVRMLARTGQRSTEDILAVVQIYYGELETLQVITARSKSKSISEKELFKLRIAVRSNALAVLKEIIEQTKDRYNVGEVTSADVAAAKAAALKAEIMIEPLKQAAGK